MFFCMLKKQMHYMYLTVLFLCFASHSALAKEQEQPVTTSMNKVTELLALNACKKPLNDLAADLIGIKKHRLLSYSKSGDGELFNALMVLEYHDRTAHVNFSAMAKKDGSCDANYTSSFFVNVPCALAREEVVKKFVYVGQLNAKTQIFKHKRKPHLQAMISPANRGKGCLVTHKTQ